ncbi:hypothetical protein OJAV_G00171780 [Oryzias javanicus]|uniref:Uncharacterized protein n=1 Tax=Oryzias javanicus TaxID=123683 RepID=A0A3S2P101_ORYJA|nr:hypothetical protein OJAV_G00171780 [Oryzias javanicus]
MIIQQRFDGAKHGNVSDSSGRRKRKRYFVSRPKWLHQREVWRKEEHIKHPCKELTSGLRSVTETLIHPDSAHLEPQAWRGRAGSEVTANGRRAGGISTMLQLQMKKTWSSM